MTVVGDVLIGIGVALMVLAGLGILRLPDVFSRMHAGTKAASLGLVCILGGTCFLLPHPVTIVKLVFALIFQLVTSPVAAHVIGRGAYRSGVELWEGTLYDELGRDVQKDR